MVVTKIESEKLTDADGLLTWLREHAHVARRGGQELIARPQAGELNVPSVETLWNQFPALQQLAMLLVLFANTEQRLQLVTSTAAVDVLNQRMTPSDLDARRPHVHFESVGADGRKTPTST
jgi:hypothetical protein